MKKRESLLLAALLANITLCGSQERPFYQNPALIIPTAGLVCAVAALSIYKYLMWHTAHSVKSCNGTYCVLKDSPKNDRSSVMVYLHGWGETAHQNPIIWGLCNNLDHRIVSFDFIDAKAFGGQINLSRYPKNTSHFLNNLFPHIDGKLGKLWRLYSGISQSNFAQLPDVLRTLKVLKKLKSEGATAITLFGRSRGAAVAVNLLAVLNNKTKKYDAVLQSIGIDASERASLLACIQKGNHILTVPMVDPDSAFPVPKWVMGLCTHYNPWGLKMKEQLADLKGLTLNITLHFQRHDSIVGNKHDTWLYQTIKKMNPDTTHMVYDESDHNNWMPNLQNSINSRYKAQMG